MQVNFNETRASASSHSSSHEESPERLSSEEWVGSDKSSKPNKKLPARGMNGHVTVPIHAYVITP